MSALQYMESIIDSFEDQVDTIFSELRDGFSSIYSGNIPDEIIAFLDEGLSMEYGDNQSLIGMNVFLIQLEDLSKRLGLEKTEHVTRVDGPEKVLAMLINVLRDVVMQFVSVSLPSTSNGQTTTTLQSVLEDVKKENISDDESGAVDVNESDILGALNALKNEKFSRNYLKIPGKSGRYGPITSNNAALLEYRISPLPIVHNRPLIQKGSTLSRHLDFSKTEKQMDEVEVALERCPFCPLNIRAKTSGTMGRTGLYTRHIREVHRDKWTSYAKIKCAAKECDYRAINFHSMKCHCYVLHTQQYDGWIDSGRFDLPPGTQCPFCVIINKDIDSDVDINMRDLAQYKQHIDEFHLEEMHKYAASIGCTCKKAFTGTCELFTHWSKDLCTGTPLLLQCLPFGPRMFNHGRVVK